MAYLLVEDEPTVELTGYLDGSGNLQISHSSGNLVDNDDSLEAEDPGETIRIKLVDFVVGTTTWVLTVAHSNPAGPISWSRSSNFAYYDFSEYMANYVTITITANDGNTSKQKVINGKTKPEGSLPDPDH